MPLRRNEEGVPHGTGPSAKKARQHTCRLITNSGKGDGGRRDKTAQGRGGGRPRALDRDRPLKGAHLSNRAPRGVSGPGLLGVRTRLHTIWTTRVSASAARAASRLVKDATRSSPPVKGTKDGALRLGPSGETHRRISSIVGSKFFNASSNACDEYSSTCSTNER